jgi:hypothetical protein
MSVRDLFGPISSLTESPYGAGSVSDLISKIIFKFIQHLPSLPSYWMSDFVGKITNYLYLRVRFKALVGYYPNIKNPRSFNEKVLYRKLFERDSRIPQLADKIAVRDYVAQKIGEQYLVPLIATYGSSKEINFDALPDKCSENEFHVRGEYLLR